MITLSACLYNIEQGISMKKTVLLVLAVMIVAVMFVGCSSTQYSFSRHVATIPLVEDEVAAKEDNAVVPEEIPLPVQTEPVAPVEAEPDYLVLTLDGISYSEKDYGECNIWYMTNYYSFEDQTEVFFQVGYTKESKYGFVLYEDSTEGTLATFSREGLSMRWDWGTCVHYGEEGPRYAFIIEPDGKTGYYYDYSKYSVGDKYGPYLCTKTVM